MRIAALRLSGALFSGSSGFVSILFSTVRLFIVSRDTNCPVRQYKKILGAATRLLSRNVVAPPVKDTAHATDWVAGASMIVRRDVIEQVGLMDERYFLYFEEVDYCRKARRAGWSCWYVPTSRVVHLVGQSTGVTDTKRPPRRVPDYWFASRRRYFRQNHGLMYCRLADAAWACSHALWRVRRWLQRKPDNDPPGLLGDFLRYNFGGTQRATA